MSILDGVVSYGCLVDLLASRLGQLTLCFVSAPLNE